MIIRHEAFNNILHKDYGDVFIQMFSNRTLSQLLYRIEKISESAILYDYKDIKIEDTITSGQRQFIGDLFEIFAEVFFLQFHSDNRVGVYDYRPVYSVDDNGVDGYGKNIIGNPCTIQVKYRSNPTYQLLERDIKQFGFQSIVNYGVDIKRKDGMVIFTNCSGINWYTDNNVFEGKIRCLNGEMIAHLIDNNEGFWNMFSKIVKDTVDSKGVEKLSEIYSNKAKKI